ncbi:MAG: hypothetical protein JO037_21995 [Actinobacteria bacterium]|nr:hypothetical protein [Actinomycetota bacterium]
MIHYGLGARNLRRDLPVLRSVIRLDRTAARIAADLASLPASWRDRLRYADLGFCALLMN